jgi:hypothetical protein
VQSFWDYVIKGKGRKEIDVGGWRRKREEGGRRVEGQWQRAGWCAFIFWRISAGLSMALLEH